jgi:hypothetical protein
MVINELMTDVVLDQTKKTASGKLPNTRRLPFVMKLFKVNEFLGGLFYSMSYTRRIRAAKISGYDKQLAPDAKIEGMTEENMKKALINLATFITVSGSIYLFSNRFTT